MSDGSRALSLAEAVRAEIGKVVVGQRDMIDSLLIGLMTGGHVLVEGVPGTAKTLLARAMAHVLEAEFKRIQFSPDMMPADVVGTNVYDSNSGDFRLRKGPVFANIVLADEINRTPPKTQAALLEAMQESQVTIDGISHPLPRPFIVIATQNPVEYEGTYPLPEAQLDRFQQKVVIGYPTEVEEAEILKLHVAGSTWTDLSELGLGPVATIADIEAAQDELTSVVVDEGAKLATVMTLKFLEVRGGKESPTVKILRPTDK